MTTQKKANLRICASCEWVFKMSENPHGVGCPKCGFGSYGAHWVYGKKCYKYARTQEPWIEHKLAKYRGELLDEILTSQKGKVQ